MLEDVQEVFDLDTPDAACNKKILPLRGLRDKFLYEVNNMPITPCVYQTCFRTPCFERSNLH